MLKDVLVEKKKNIAIISLDRPEALNAMSLDMREGLADTFEELAELDDVRAVVLTGSGKAFSAGGDMKSWEGPDKDKIIKSIMEFARRTITAITSLEKPVIAMVNGDAIGAGCNLALACDLVIASENARFGEVFVKIGLGPDWGGAYHLLRRIGMVKTKELLFTGKIFSAQEALDMGLINQIVPLMELEETTMKLAEKLSRSATRAIGMTKSYLHSVWQMDIKEALKYEASMQIELMKTIDHKESVKAFFNKSKAVFIGK